MQSFNSSQEMLYSNSQKQLELIFIFRFKVAPDSVYKERKSPNQQYLASFCFEESFFFFLNKNLERPQRMHNLIICTFSGILHLPFSASLHKGIPSSEVCTWTMNHKHQKSQVNQVITLRMFVFNPLVTFVIFSYLKQFPFAIIFIYIHMCVYLYI